MSLVGLRTVVAVGLLLALASVLHAQQPILVFSVRGVDELLDDAEFLGAAAGQEGTKEAAENFITAFTGGKGLAGIDRTKPLGVYWNATAGGSPEWNDIMFVAFLPVADAENLKDLLTNLTPDFEESKGQWSMTVNGTKLFAKVSNGYCFATPNPKMLTKLPDPTKIVNPQYDIAIDVNFASIPQGLKDQFLEQTEANGRQALEAGPEPRNEAEAKGRQIGFEATLAVMKALVNGSDRLTLGIDANRKTHLLATEVAVTSRPNTDLAGAMAAYRKTQPALASIGSENAPFRWNMSFPTARFLDPLDDLMASMRDVAISEIDKDAKLKTDADRAAAKDIASRMFDILRATAESESIDSAMAFERAKDGKLCLIGASKVARGDEAGKVLDDVLKLAKDNPEIGKLHMDLASHNGARIHAIDANSDEDARKIFGTEPTHLGIHNDSLWLAMGSDNLTQLKNGLDQSGKLSPRTVSPISLRVKPATLVTLMEHDDMGLIERAKAIAGKPGDFLNLDIAPTPTGARLRLEFSADLFKLAKSASDGNN